MSWTITLTLDDAEATLDVYLHLCAEHGIDAVDITNDDERNGPPAGEPAHLLDAPPGLSLAQSEAWAQGYNAATAGRDPDAEQFGNPSEPIDVGCPTCGAEPGEPCHSPSLKRYRDYIHIARKAATP